MLEMVHTRIQPSAIRCINNFKKKKIAGLKVAICGDIMHSRVARSNIHLLNTLWQKLGL